MTLLMFAPSEMWLSALTLCGCLHHVCQCSSVHALNVALHNVCVAAPNSSSVQRLIRRLESWFGTLESQRKLMTNCPYLRISNNKSCQVAA